VPSTAHPKSARSWPSNHDHMCAPSVVTKRATSQRMCRCAPRQQSNRHLRCRHLPLLLLLAFPLPLGPNLRPQYLHHCLQMATQQLTSPHPQTLHRVRQGLCIPRLNPMHLLLRHQLRLTLHHQPLCNERQWRACHHNVSVTVGCRDAADWPLAGVSQSVQRRGFGTLEWFALSLFVVIAAMVARKVLR